RDLLRPAAGVSRRCHRLRRPIAYHVGANSAFLQHTLLRLPVRDLLRAECAEAVDQYLTLLKSGGSDHPMSLLQRAGVDLSKPETVQAVVDQLDTLVSKLEQAIGK